MSAETVRELRGLVFSVVTLVFLLYAVKNESDKRAILESREAVKVVADWITSQKSNESQAREIIDQMSRLKDWKK